MSMRADIFDLYWQAITPIEAQNAMLLFDVSSYPNMKDNARRKIHKKYHQAAYPKTWSNVPRVSADKFFGKPKVKDGQ